MNWASASISTSSTHLTLGMHSDYFLSTIIYKIFMATSGMLTNGMSHLWVYNLGRGKIINRKELGNQNNWEVEWGGAHQNMPDSFALLLNMKFFVMSCKYGFRLCWNVG